MALLAQIKSAQLQARKSRDHDKAASLTTLIADVEMIGKNAGRETTESEAVAVLKKFIKNAHEVARVAGDYRDESASDKAWAEITLYESFLPAQLSEEQLKDTVASLILELTASTPKEMGKVMKVLKERYDGQFDGQLASATVKELLSK